MLPEITSKFFDNSQPCPEQIPDCENLRIEYMQTLEGLRRNGGCSGCQERNLKNTFIAKIAALIRA